MITHIVFLQIQPSFWCCCCCCCLVTKSCLILCDPMDYSLPDSSVHGISQARILEWVATSFSRDLPDPGLEPASLAASALAGVFFATEPPGKPITKYSLTHDNNFSILKFLQLCHFKHDMQIELYTM